MSKRVLLFSHEFPPAVGGAGTVAQDVSHILSKINNYHITVMCNHIEGRRKSKDYKIIEVKSLPKLRPLFYWNKLKHLDLDGFYSIIINDIGAALVAAYFFPVELQRKCTVFLHGSEPEEIFQNNIFPYFNFKRKYIDLLKNCKNIIAVSNFMKEKFMKITKLDYLNDKICIVYNGIDTNFFFPNKINLYKRYNISPDKTLLLTVSRIVKGKGFDRMYNLFKVVAKKYNYHWLIIGAGDYLSELMLKVKNDGMVKFITFVGKVERNELKEYYSSADLFWLLSDLNESFGLVYLEANACGIPVLANNRAGTQE
ncbi:glycosyltransferase family 4 protein, partial [Neobacillus drentensis]|uniref:glycosyltransferase family 4 protein n=1 Tax=Neobacillus drentensis TaxID=220684 RepID=UPI002FFF6B17